MLLIDASLKRETLVNELLETPETIDPYLKLEKKELSQAWEIDDDRIYLEFSAIKALFKLS